MFTFAAENAVRKLLLLEGFVQGMAKKANALGLIKLLLYQLFREWRSQRIHLLIVYCALKRLMLQNSIPVLQTTHAPASSATLVSGKGFDFSTNERMVK